MLAAMAATTCVTSTVRSLKNKHQENVTTFCSRSPSSRTVFIAAVVGLGFAWSCTSDVRQQPSQRPHHFRGLDSAELLVGSQRLCGHTLCHYLSINHATEQVCTINYIYNVKS